MADEMQDATLTSAVTKAVQDMSSVQVQEHESNTTSAKTTDTTTLETNSGDASSESQIPQSDPQLNLQDIQDAEQGKVLIRALRDPNSSAQVIDFIARQAGYTKIETKQEAKAAARDINTILEENLGEEFKFLAPKLGPAIEESLMNLLTSHENSRLQNLQSRVEKQEYKEIQNETTKTHVALSQEWFGTDDMPSNVIQAMSKAMDEFPPADPNMSPARYYNRIFQLAVGELGITRKGGAKNTANQSDRIARNQSDSTARSLAAQNRGVTPSVDGNPRKLSLKDAVSLAMEQVNQSSRK